MAAFQGGIIPTIKVSNNTLINTAVTGVAGNLLYTGVSVGVSQLLGATLSESLGLDPKASFGNIGSIITNGVVGIGSQYLDQVISSQITNSKALGPFGPLVGGIAQGAAGVLTRGVTGLLTGQGFSGFQLGGLFGGGQAPTRTSASAPNTERTTAFPGGDDKPYGDRDANYEGSVYNRSKDVLFAIKPAVSPAQTSAAAEVAETKVPAKTSLTTAFTAQPLAAVGAANTDTFQKVATGQLAGVGSSFTQNSSVGTSEWFAGVGGISSAATSYGYTPLAKDSPLF